MRRLFFHLSLVCSLAAPGGLAWAADPDLRPWVQLNEPAPAAAPIVATYVVEQHDTLSEVSIKLFGTSKRWKDIARWNNLPDANKIRFGKRLKLEVEPTVDLAVGNLLLLEMWRHRFGVDIEKPGPKTPEEARIYLARHDRSNQERVTRSLASWMMGSIEKPRTVVNEPTHKAQLEEVSLFSD